MGSQSKIHTTNYSDTFIEVAEDCSVFSGTVPVAKNGKRTVAVAQYEMMARNPYKYTSDDVLFMLYAEKNDLAESECPEARVRLFSKGQPCLRTSPLAKQFGWGIHHNYEGKVALYGIESEEYQTFLNDSRIKKVKAMRMSKK